MKKTTFLPILGLVVAAVLFTAFSATSAFHNDPEVSFQEFLQQFPQQRLPYALDEASLKVRLDQYVALVNHPSAEHYNSQPKRLDGKYFQFLPDLAGEARFSRIPMQAEPIAQFASDNYIAVMYTTSRSFRYGYATYHLSVFDKTGHQISSNMVGQVMPETIISAIIFADLQAELKTWRIEWKKDYGKNGLDGNKIKGLANLETTLLDLTKPTLKKPRNYDLLIAPTVIEAEPVPAEGAKSK